MPEENLYQKLQANVKLMKEKIKKKNKEEYGER